MSNPLDLLLSIRSTASLTGLSDFTQLIAKRKGFVKLAIETGASLVPVLAFGENEAFGRLLTYW